MSEPAYKEYTVQILQPTAGSETDKMYDSLFGVMDLFNQIGLDKAEQQHVMKTLSVFLNIND